MWYQAINIFVIKYVKVVDGQILAGWTWCDCEVYTIFKQDGEVNNKFT